MGKSSHILVIPFPAQGHINPMLQFSKRLASRGLRVTLITTTFMSNSLPQLQVATTNIQVGCIYDGYKAGDKAANIDEHLVRFKAIVPQTLPELINKQLSSDHPPTVLVYDSVMPWAADIAKGLGLLSAAFFTQSCAVCAIYYHYSQGNLKVPSQGSPSPLEVLPALPAMEVSDLPSFIVDTISYPNLFTLVADLFYSFEKADWLLFNSFHKLEEEVVNWMARQWPVKTIGPTLPSMYLDKRMEDDRDYGLSLFAPSTESCMKWLNARDKASVLYVSFGSLASLGEEQMGEIAEGLKHSNAYFLWVVRASEEGKLPNGFKEETSEKGLVVNWCPQLDVLAHQAVGCFMTHCGWNSTLEALSLGVPMVVMPQWTDQTTNAKYIADVWSAGVRVKVSEKGIITRGEIELRIKEVMEGERGADLRRSALRWKQLSKEAVDEGGTSDRNIEEFVSELVCT